MRHSYPKFPFQGAPTSQELLVCFEKENPTAKHEQTQLVQELRNNSTSSNLVQPRSLHDTIQVLGKVMGVGQKPVCREEKEDREELILVPSTLHDEFAWWDSVVAIADDLCNQVKDRINEVGLTNDGGIAYAVQTIMNAHDKQGNSLANGRRITATLTPKYRSTIRPG
jgi:hypothetical protein